MLIRPIHNLLIVSSKMSCSFRSAAGVTGINFAFQASTELLERLADALVSGRIVAPPITRIALEEAPAVLSQAQPRPADGKTVIKL